MKGKTMKAEKITLSITLEALSPDCFYGMLCQLTDQIEQGSVSGKLVADDGDTIEWATTRKLVEF